MKSNFKTKDEIKEAVDILDYALLNGYTIDKDKSTQHWVRMNNSSTGDRILVKPKIKMYSNIDYENDKGDILQFVANRLHGNLSIDKSNEAFYKALVDINKFLGNHLNDNNRKILTDKEKYFTKKEKLSTLQATEWNHQPITDYSYLTNQRAIDITTLKDPLFEGKLFNTYFRMESGHLITNYAFGKYTNDTLVGLEVRNNTIKTILGDHDGVFYTNTQNMSKIDGVFYAESGIDIASYIEILHKNPEFDREKNYCFLSFSGNLYESKMNKIISDLERLPLTSETKFISLTDNDFDKEESKRPGKNYDVLFTAALINKHITPLEFTNNEAFYCYTFKETNKIDLDVLRTKITSQNEFIDQKYGLKERYGKYVILKDTEQGLTLNIPKTIPLNEALFQNMLTAINGARFYIPHKPKTTNDWNEELQRRKGIQIQEKKKETLIQTEKIKKNAKRL